MFGLLSAPRFDSWSASRVVSKLFGMYANLRTRGWNSSSVRDFVFLCFFSARGHRLNRVDGNVGVLLVRLVTGTLTSPKSGKRAASVSTSSSVENCMSSSSKPTVRPPLATRKQRNVSRVTGRIGLEVLGDR